MVHQATQAISSPDAIKVIAIIAAVLVVMWLGDRRHG